MNILYIYAHPNSLSFNKTLKDHSLTVLKRQHAVRVSDLYAECFNPVASWNDFKAKSKDLNAQYFLAQQEAFNQNLLVSDITAELDKIAWADHIIFQFPLWWFSVPAILKGWLDRVLVKGFAYDSGKVFDQGLLKGKTASLMVSTQSPAEAYQPEGVHHATIDAFLFPIHHTLRFVGMETLPPFIVYGAFKLDDKREQQILIEQTSYLNQLMKK